MSQPYTGGCACGAIRYDIAAEPMMMSDCQCSQCQRQSGTGHSSYLNFPRAAVTLKGEARAWEVTGEGGTVKSCAFCPTCGSPVYMTFPAMPDLFIVRAGSLDDPGRYQPQMIFWTAAGHAWDRTDPALPKFEKLPPR
jgi:hypothetical protein